MTACSLINSKEYLNRNSNRTRAFAFVHAGWGGGAGPVAAGVSRGACRRRQVRTWSETLALAEQTCNARSAL